MTAATREAEVPMLKWTALCPKCRQASMVNRTGGCYWCGSPTSAIRLPQRGPRAGPTPQEAISLHGYCVTENVSVRIAVARQWRRWGYRSDVVCADVIARMWRTMGLPTPNPHGVGAHRRSDTEKWVWEPSAVLSGGGDQ